MAPGVLWPVLTEASSRLSPLQNFLPEDDPRFEEPKRSLYCIKSKGVVDEQAFINSAYETIGTWASEVPGLRGYDTRKADIHCTSFDLSTVERRRSSLEAQERLADLCTKVRSLVG